MRLPAFDASTSLGQLALLPVQDALSAAAWVAGAFGRSIGWGDRAYDLLPDGRLGIQRQ